MIEILYTLSKILLTAAALGISVLFLFGAYKSKKIIRELRNWEDFLRKQAARDWSMYSLYSAICNSLLGFFIRNNPIVKACSSPAWFKLLRMFPFTRKFCDYEHLYHPIRKIIDSSFEISNKLKNR